MTRSSTLLAHFDRSRHRTISVANGEERTCEQLPGCSPRQPRALLSERSAREQASNSAVVAGHNHPADAYLQERNHEYRDRFGSCRRCFSI